MLLRVSSSHLLCSQTWCGTQSRGKGTKTERAGIKVEKRSALHFRDSLGHAAPGARAIRLGTCTMDGKRQSEVRLAGSSDMHACRWFGRVCWKLTLSYRHVRATYSGCIGPTLAMLVRLHGNDCDAGPAATTRRFGDVLKCISLIRSTKPSCGCILNHMLRKVSQNTPVPWGRTGPMHLCELCCFPNRPPHIKKNPALGRLQEGL